MEHSDAYYHELARKWADGSITPAEAKEYLDWYNADDEHPLEVPHNFVHNKEELEQRMLASMQQQIMPAAPVIPYRKRFIRIAAAAAVLIMLGSVSWFAFFNKPAAKAWPVAKIQDPGFRNDVLPGNNAAILTLANGKEVILDAVAMGQLAQQGNTVIVGQNGELVYNGKTTEPLYNTLRTKKGQAYSLTLADGTKVWLNAASSIHYPVSFTGHSRAVEITGEAYFEVARNEAMPFYVRVNGMEVKVLGTHFNINAYPEEGAIRTTLLEGKVKVSATQSETRNPKPETILTPGEQANLQHNQLTVATNVDITGVMAWKNGLFGFKSADIETVLRQVMRWYDIEVKYEGARTKDRFNGDIPRTATLTELLSILKASRVNFKLEGNTLTVLP